MASWSSPERLTSEDSWLVSQLRRFEQIAVRPGTHSNLPSQLETAVRAFGDALGTEMNSLLLVDHASSEVLHAAAVGISETHARSLVPLLLGNLPGLADPGSYDSCIVIEDTRADARFHQYLSISDAGGFFAMLSVPLINSTGNVFGFLSSYYRTPYRPGPEEVQRARQLAIAIERLHAEEALAATEREYRELFDKARDAILIIDHENDTVLDVNLSACELYELSREEFIGRSFKSLLKNPQTDYLVAADLIQTNRAIPSQNVHLTGSGAELFVEVHASFVNYKGKRAIQAINRDVTASRRAEAALKESEERFSKAFHLSPNAMAIVTPQDGRYVDVNDAALRQFGYSREEVVGRTSLEIGFWAEPEQRKAMIGLLNIDGSVRDFEMKFRNGRGELRTGLFSAEIIEVGGRKCMLGSVHDITERKIAEDKLRASEERFSKAFHSNPNPMCIFTYREARCIDANESCLRLVGYTREEMIGRTADEIETWGAIGEQVRAARDFGRRGPFRRVEVQVRNRVGVKITVLLGIEIIELAGERCVLIAGSDVTDRKRAEQERSELLASERLARTRAESARQVSAELLLREQAARTEAEEAHREWQRTFDMMTDLVMVVSMDDRLLRANRSFYRKLRLRAEQCIGRSITELMHPPNGKYPFAENCPACQFRRRGEQGAIEVPAGMVSGYPFLASFDPIVNSNGETVAVIQVIRDLTDLHQAREAAARERIGLDATIEQMADGLVVFDRVSGVVRANRHAERLFGFTREEMIADSNFVLREGRFFRENGTPVPAQQLPVNEALRRQTNIECRGWYQHPNGERLLLSVNVSPLFDAGQKLVGAIALFRDVTEQQRKRERALQADKLRALGQLASGVAHNLNNALAAVLGYTQLALPKTEEASDVERYLRVVEQSAKDAARMVERIQNFSRARSANDEFISLRVVDLVRDVIDITKPRWRNDAESRSIKYDVRLELHDLDDVLINGEPSELREVFINIIFNALDAMPEGGRLRIDVVSEGSEVAISFSDTGIGMTDDLRKRIFEPFFTTKGVAGLGMGLSESYRIVERHGGRIDVESRPMQGSTFQIRLPLITFSETNCEAERDQRAGPRARILVIEDDEPVRLMLSTMLTDLGHSVVTAASAEEGLAMLKLDRFEMVFTDLAMPSLDGISAASRIKARSPGTRVVLMTGYGAERARELAAGSNNVDSTISKPFSSADVRATILSLLS